MEIKSRNQQKYKRISCIQKMMCQEANKAMNKLNMTKRQLTRKRKSLRILMRIQMSPKKRQKAIASSQILLG